MLLDERAQFGRWGGDEFVLLVDGRETGAQRVVERLRAASTAHTASAGVAEWDGAEAAHQRLARADAALYAAKGRRSRNRQEARS